MVAAADLAQTEAFIAYNPVDITLKRRAVEETSRGGRKRGAARSLATYTVRVVEMLRIESRAKRLSSSGDLLVPSHIVTFMPDADVRVHDTFRWDGQTWEVLDLSTLPAWRINAEVIGRG